MKLQELSPQKVISKPAYASWYITNHQTRSSQFLDVFILKNLQTNTGFLLRSDSSPVLLAKIIVITCLLLLLKHLTFYCVIVLVSSKSCSGEKNQKVDKGVHWLRKKNVGRRIARFNMKLTEKKWSFLAKRTIWIHFVTWVGIPCNAGMRIANICLFWKVVPWPPCWSSFNENATALPGKLMSW